MAAGTMRAAILRDALLPRPPVRCRLNCSRATPKRRGPRSSGSGNVLRHEYQRVDEKRLLAADALRERIDALLQALEVGEHQLGLDRLDVGDRIDGVGDMRHVAIVEAAHHMRDRVDLADIARN